MIKPAIIIIVTIALAAIILGGLTLYQQEVSNDSLLNNNDSVDSLKESNDESITEINDTRESAQSPAENPGTSKASYEGIHIMPDGKVMDKEGKEIIDAKILANGQIQLSDGTIVTPVIDSRSAPGPTKSEASDSAPKHVVVDVVGVDYSYDIKQIRVKQGDTVTINFKSNKGFHDIVIDEFGVATARVNEGEGVTSVTFVADKVGTFQFYCSVMNHRQMGMVGYLIVEER